MKFFTFLSTIVLVSSGSAQIEQQPEGNVSHPIETPHGIVFTDNTKSSLYLLNNGIAEELVSAPGCGMYYTISPDKRTVGFKYITGDRMQSPAVLDLSSKKFTLLHTPVLQAGQVSFSKSGAFAYSIGGDVFIHNGTVVEKISIGTYANIVSLSPDGEYIAYNDDHNQLFVRDVRSHDVLQITRQSIGFCEPNWSSVGKTLCYSRLDGHVFVFDMESGQTSVLGEGYNPAWSADGASIILERRVTEQHTLLNSDLFQISGDGKTVRQLTDTKNIFETEPSVAADGSLLFSAHNDDAVYSSAGKHAAVRIPVEKILPLTNNEEKHALQKIASPSVYFEMPYANQVYDTPDWYNGHSACGPTSSIMVIAYYGILPVWNVWCSASGSSPGHYSAYGNYVCDKYRFKQTDYVSSAQDPNGKPSWGGYGYMWGSGSPYSRMTYYYANHGISASRSDSSSSIFSLITNEVTGGYPYTLCNGLTTAGHIVVVNGIGSEAHTFIVNDPYGNKNSGKYPSVNGKGVSYDWPGYNNGHQNLNRIYWGVAVRYTPPASADSIVDDLEFTKGFQMSNTIPATMFSWKDMNKGYNGHMWYVKTKKSDTCFAQWRPTIAQDGHYEVSAYIVYSNSQAAQYKIYHKNGSETVVINQKILTDSWVSLGTFPFAQGTSGYIRLGDGSDSTGQEIVFDAVKFKYVSPLSVKQTTASVPTEIELSQNYPNPFNPATTISFSIPDVSVSSRTVLQVYDVLGNEIATLVDGRLSAGRYSVPFNAAWYASGVYIYRLRIGNNVLTRRMMLVK